MNKSIASLPRVGKSLYQKGVLVDVWNGARLLKLQSFQSA